jgi:hypothetical protein
MTDRDYFAAAALTRGMGVLGRDQIAKSCYEMADAMLLERERGRTNHDAAPAAKAYADGEPAPKCGGEAGLNPRDGTGNTPALSESEREAIEQMLDEVSGKAWAESWVPATLRSLLERLK